MSFVRPIPPVLIEPIGGVNPYRATRRVRGARQFQDMAAALNWLEGTGSSLVLAGPYHGASITPGNSIKFKYYTWQHEQNPNRLWVLTLLADGDAHGTFDAPDGTTIGKWSAPSAYSRTTQSWRYIQAVSSPSSTPEAITVKVANSSSSTGNVYVEGIKCYELPRYWLDTFSALTAPDEESCSTKQPIFAESGNELSVNGVAAASSAIEDECRRACLFSWYNPAGVVITDTSDPATASNVLAIDVPIQPRSLYASETSRNISWRVFAKVTGTSPSGSVRVRAEPSGTSSSVTLTGTTESDYGSTVIAQTEDPSRRLVDGGLRGGNIGALRLTAWKTAGTSITVYGFCAGEYPR